MTAEGIRCEVAAPSKLHCPAGDRVKTDARDALHLARLLRLDEVVSVRVPTETQEAARIGCVPGRRPGRILTSLSLTAPAFWSPRAGCPRGGTRACSAGVLPNRGR